MAVILLGRSGRFQGSLLGRHQRLRSIDAQTSNLNERAATWVRSRAHRAMPPPEGLGSMLRVYRLAQQAAVGASIINDVVIDDDVRDLPSSLMIRVYKRACASQSVSQQASSRDAADPPRTRLRVDLVRWGPARRGIWSSGNHPCHPPSLKPGKVEHQGPDPA